MPDEKSPAETMRVQYDIVETIEKRQALGSLATAFLAMLVALLTAKSAGYGTITVWFLLVLAASVFKAALSHYRSLERFRDVGYRTRRGLLVVSACLTGILWGVPMLFLDFQNPIELATVMLIVSGIISGAVSTYLGDFVCMSFISTIPCAAMIGMMAVKMTPLPAVTILSTVTFYVYICILSSYARNNNRDLLTAKHEKSRLVDRLTTAQSTLIDLANRDDLTGLPNRRCLADFFVLAQSDSDRRGEKFAILFIDLDHFKHINDTHGHEAGDRTLVEVARILQASLRSSDMVARLGGDEFTALIRNVGGRGSAEAVAAKIGHALEAAVRVDGLDIRLGASIGVSIYPDDAASLDRLLNIADASMYADKRRAGGCRTQPLPG